MLNPGSEASHSESVFPASIWNQLCFLWKQHPFEAVLRFINYTLVINSFHIFNVLLYIAFCCILSIWVAFCTLVYMKSLILFFLIMHPCTFRTWYLAVYWHKEKLQNIFHSNNKLYSCSCKLHFCCPSGFLTPLQWFWGVLQEKRVWIAIFYFLHNPEDRWVNEIF